MNRKDLRAPTLEGPPQLYQGSGPPRYTTARQMTLYEKYEQQAETITP